MVEDKGRDKLDILMKRWQQETRDEIKKNGEQEFDFLNPSRDGGSPSGLMDRVKEQTRTFVED